MYRLAYEEGQRTLDDQVEELNGIRTRAVAYLAFIGTATAFLVGTSLKAAETAVDRNLFFFVVAGAATALLAFTLVTVLRVLVPKDAWDYHVPADRLIEDWIESDVPPPNEAHLLRALALLYNRMSVHNSKILAKIRRLYTLEIGAGTLQLILWVSLAWLFV